MSLLILVTISFNLSCSLEKERGSFSLFGKPMERKKTKSQVKLVKLKDAINLIDQHVNLLGIVRDRKEPKLCRNNGNPESSFLLILPDFEGFRLLLFFVSVYHLIVSAWICTLCIIDDSYERPGLTVNVFSNKREELPNHDGMILFLNIKVLFGFCFRCFCLKEDIKKTIFFICL